MRLAATGTAASRARRTSARRRRRRWRPPRCARAPRSPATWARSRAGRSGARAMGARRLARASQAPDFPSAYELAVRSADCRPTQRSDRRGGDHAEAVEAGHRGAAPARRGPPLRPRLRHRRSPATACSANGPGARALSSIVDTSHVVATRRAATSARRTTRTRSTRVAVYCQELKRCYWLPIDARRQAMRPSIYAWRLLPTTNSSAINFADRLRRSGAIAQLGERVAGSHEVGGSSPLAPLRGRPDGRPRSFPGVLRPRRRAWAPRPRAARGGRTRAPPA